MVRKGRIEEDYSMRRQMIPEEKDNLFHRIMLTSYSILSPITTTKIISWLVHLKAKSIKNQDAKKEFL